jgi:Zn-dependent protease
MKSSYKVAEVMRIPIRLHITLIVFLPLLILYVASAVELNLLLALLAVAGFFASIALHELGHAAVAMRYGCGVRQILLMPIGGVAQLSHIPDSPRAEIWIAIAGPAVSLALSIVCFLLAIPLGGLPLGGLARVFTVWSAINLVLVLFNLLPSFPMDGGRVFRALMTPRIGRLRATYIASRVGRFMAILFGVFGALRFDFILMAIAFFIHRAATAEYLMVQVQEARRVEPPPHPGMWFGSRPPPAQPRISDEVVVSPPPYARGSSPGSRPRRGLFTELLEDFGDR